MHVHLAYLLIKADLRDICNTHVPHGNRMLHANETEEWPEGRVRDLLHLLK